MGSVSPLDPCQLALLLNPGRTAELTGSFEYQPLLPIVFTAHSKSLSEFNSIKGCWCADFLSGFTSAQRISLFVFL